jgi:hypothetical protein
MAKSFQAQTLTDFPLFCPIFHLNRPAMPPISLPSVLFPLVSRDHCSQCGCEGTAFGQVSSYYQIEVYINPPLISIQSFPPCSIPSDAQQLCGCNHKYWQHHLIQSSLPDVANVLSAARGSCRQTGCGGFYPLVRAVKAQISTSNNTCP